MFEKSQVDCSLICKGRHPDEEASHRIINILHGYMVWIEKSVTRVTDRHHEACRVMPNSDPE